MPAVIPLVVGLAATLGATALGVTGTILGISYAAIIGTVVSIGAGLLTSALTKPKASRPTTVGTQEDRKQLIRGSVEPRQFIYGYARVSGAIVYAASSGDNLRYLHLVVVLANHRCQDIPVVWINGQTIRDSDCDGAGNVTRSDHPMRDRVRIEKFRGQQTSGSANLAGESPDGWSSTHILAGCTYLYIRLEFDQERMPGLQSIEAEVVGKNDILDPRSGATGFTSNWALCVLDYLRHPDGLDCTDDELDLASFQSAANLSAEAVQIAADGTTQQRFTCDGAFKLDRAPIDIMEAMLSGGGGALCYVQGQYRLHGAAYSAPTASIGPGDMAGEMEIVPRAARKDLFNGVRGTFIDPSRGYQASEFGAVFDPGYDAQDGGERIWKDIEFPFTADNIRAQRLAFTVLLRARQSLRIKVPMKYAALRLCVWQMVAVTHPDLGLSAKPMRIIGWDYEPNTGGVVVEMQAEAAVSYSWLYEAAYSAPSPADTTLINPLELPTPAPPGLTATTALADDGSIVPIIAVTWTPVAHAFVTGMEVQWRLDGGAWSSAWVRVGTERYDIKPAVVGGAYDVRIRSASQFGRSAWSTIIAEYALPDATVPGAPSGVVATGTLRGIRVTWSRVTVRDIDRYRVYERLNAGSAWYTAADTYTTDYLRSGLLPGEAREFQVSAIDRSANEGNRSSVVGASASLLVVEDIAAGIINTASFASDIEPLGLVEGIPTIKTTEVVVNKLNGMLYRWNGTAYTAEVPTVDLVGTLADAQIAALDAAKLTGTMNVARIADGALADTKLRGGVSGNQIWNSCAANGLAGWEGGFAPHEQGGSTKGAIFGGAVGQWRLSGFGSGYISRAALAAGQAMDLYWLPGGIRLSCQAGLRYEFQARVISLNAPVGINIAWYTAAGAYISETYLAGANASSATSGKTLGDYTRLFGFATAPTGAVAAMPFLRVGSGAHTNPSLIFTQTLFGEARANQTDPSVWSPGATSDSDPAIFPVGSVTDALLGNTISAAKISGALTAATIAAAGVNSGTLGLDRIPSIPDAKIGDVSPSKLNAALTSSNFDNSLRPPERMSTLPVTGNFAGRIVYLTTDNQLYRYTGSAWTAEVPAVNLTGQVTDAQIAGVAATKLAGQVQDAQVAALAASKVTGQLTDAQIAAVAAAKVTGTLVDGQLAGISASKLAGQVQDAQIAAMAASKLGGQITTTQITDDAISTPKMQTGSVVTATLAAGSVTASKLIIAPGNICPDPQFDDTAFWAPDGGGWYIDIGGVNTAAMGARRAFALWDGAYTGTARKHVWSPVVSPLTPASAGQTLRLRVRGRNTSSQTIHCDIHFLDAAGTYVGGNGVIWTSADSAVAGTVKEVQALVPAASAFYRLVLYNLAPGSAWNGVALITDVQIALASDAAMIVDGGIIASKIAVNAVTAGKIEAGAVTTAKLDAGAVTADKIFANAVTTAKLDAGAVTTAKIGAGEVQAGNIAAGAVTTAKLSVVSNNEIWNSCCTLTTAGWGGYSEAGGGSALTEFAACSAFVPAYSLAGVGSGYMFKAGTTNGPRMLATWSQVIPVTPSKKYQIAALLNAHRCTGYVILAFYTAAGGYVEERNSSTTTFSAGAGTQEGHYERVTGIVTAPGGAAYAYLNVCGLTTGQENPYLFFTKVLVSETVANATEVGVWSPGGVTQISGGQIIARSIKADAIEALSIRAGELASNAVTADKIQAGQVTAGKLSAGAVAADNIQANAIRAQHLFVMGNNLILDPEFTEAGFWSGLASGNGVVANLWRREAGFGGANAALGSASCVVMNSDVHTGTGEVYLSSQKRAGLVGGQVMRLQAKVVNASNSAMQIFVQFYDASGNFLSPIEITNAGFMVWAAGEAVTAPNFGVKSIQFTVPAGAEQYAIHIQKLSGPAFSGYIAIVDPQLIPAAEGSLIVDGAISATKIGAGQVSADKLSIGASGQNVCWNSLMLAPIASFGAPDGWNVGGDTAGVGFPVNLGIDSGATLLGARVAYMNYSGSGFGAQSAMYARWAPTGDSQRVVAVTPGQRMQASAYVQTVRCNVYLVMDFFTSASAYVAASTFTSQVVNTGDGARTTLGNFTRIGVLGTAPAGSHYCRVYLRAFGDATPTSDPYVFFTHFMFGRANPLQTVLDEFQPGGATEITGGLIRTDAIQARHLQADSVAAGKIAADAITSREIIAGAITTAELAVASNNVIWNSCCTLTAKGWSAYADWGNGPGVLSASVNDPLYTLNGVGSGRLYAATTVNGQRMLAQWDEPLSVVQGQKIQVAALVTSLNVASTKINVTFYTAAGGYITELDGNLVANQGFTDGKTLDRYGRTAAVFTVPTGAYLAYLRIAGNCTGASNAYVFFTHVVFGAAPPNATEVAAWSPGGVTRIDGGQITARTVTANQIVADTITGNEIAANTVTASEIQSRTITADRIATGTLTANELSANSVTTTQLAAGSVTASKVVIRGNDLVLDPQFDDSSYWSFDQSPGWYFETSESGLAGARRYAVLWSGNSAGGAAYGLRATRLQAVTSGQVMRIRCLARTDQAPNKTVRVVAEFLTAALANVSAPGIALPVGVNTAATVYEAQVTVPAGAVYVRPVIYVDAGAGWSGLAVVSDISIMVASTGALIVDGAITANKIGAAEVVAGKLAAGSVLTSNLAVGGSNLIWNSTFSTGKTEGWVAFSTNGTPGFGVNLSTNFKLRGYGTAFLNPTAGVFGGDQYVTAHWQPAAGYVGIKFNARYQASVLMQAHRCTGRLDILWYDGNLAYISESQSAVTTLNAATAIDEGQYARLTVLATAPSTAVFAIPRVVMFGNGGTAPYLFWSKMLFGEAVANAVEVGPWEAAGVTQISGGLIIADTITAEQIAANAITADKLAANSIIAGKIAAGAISSTEIAAGEIKAVNLASTTLITLAAQMGTAVIGSAQIQDLSVARLKIASGAVTTMTGTSASNNVTISRPAIDTYTYSSLASLEITVPSGQTSNVVVLCEPVESAFTAVTFTGSEGGSGSDGSGS